VRARPLDAVSDGEPVPVSVGEVEPPVQAAEQRTSAAPAPRATTCRADRRLDQVATMSRSIASG